MTDENSVFDICLSDQEAVEWIFVMIRQIIQR